jgi:hypothetical protein
MSDDDIKLFRLVMGRDPVPGETITIMEATDGQ